MTVRSAGANSRAAARALRVLRREDRLDELGQALGVLLVTSAGLVDAATGRDSDVAAYARAQVIRAHGQLLAQLAAMVGPVDDEESSLARLLAQLAGPPTFEGADNVSGFGDLDGPSRFG